MIEAAYMIAMSGKNSKIFGFWLPVYDEETARAAAKMGGLPVLILGVNIVLLSFLEFSKNTIPSEAAIAGGLIAALLIFFAFRIRANRFASLPYLVVLVLLFYIVVAVSAFLLGLVTGGVLFGGMYFLVKMIIPAIATVLAVSGMRGWLWLRKNKTKMFL